VAAAGAVQREPRAEGGLSVFKDSHCYLPKPTFHKFDFMDKRKKSNNLIDDCFIDISDCDI
jgi:hypothetical protein